MVRPPSRLAGCPVTKWLLISNIAVFLLDVFLFGGDNGNLGRLTLWGYFSAELAVNQFQIWRFLTFQFLHANGLHLVTNMIAIYMFGTFVERWWGSKKFTVFYLTGGVAGALCSMAFFYLGWFDKSPSGVGASAGAFAIMVCTAVIAPKLRVLLFFVVPMSMRTLAIGCLVFSAFMILTKGNNAGGEAGHLGGAVLGFILMKNPHWLSFLDGKSGIGKRRRRVQDAQVVREKKIRPRVNIDLSDTEIDRILDKVSSEGIQSLTDAEREALVHASGKK